MNVKARICALLFICSSCSFLFTSDENDRKLHQVFLTLGKEIPKGNYILLVQTNLGCGICNDNVTDFIKLNSNSKGLFCIIPFSSNKEMKIKYTSNILNKKNVIIDYKRDAISLGIILEHSIIFFVKEDKIEKKIELNPYNITVELRKLKSELKYFK